jgi:hypothetical protein
VTRAEQIDLVLQRLEQRTRALGERGELLGYVERTLLCVEQRCDLALLRSLVLPPTLPADQAVRS